MSLKKIDHVRKAYERLVISGITSVPSPREMSMGLERQEDMMYELHSRNICSSWVFEDQPSPNTDSGLDPAFNFAVETNLAVRLCDIFGKEPTMQLTKSASSSLSNWSARSSKTNMIDYPDRQPRGSGNTFRMPRWARYYRIQGNIPTSCDSINLKVGQKDTYFIDFSNYLMAGSEINDYKVDMKYATGVELIESVKDNSGIILNLKGKKEGSNRIVVTVDTTAGRINPESIYIAVTQT